MDPTTLAILRSWSFRPEVILPLTLAAALYVRGWRQLRAIAQQRESSTERTNPRPPLATGWKLAAYLTALSLIAISLMSPIDALGGQLFFMHMVQHIPLLMWAPILIWIASPFPIVLWGLPRNARLTVGDVMARNTLVRRGLRFLSAPAVGWFAFLVFLLGWHDSNMYNAALRYDWVHDVQHLTFFSAAMLFWWHVVGAAPRFRRNLGNGARLAYVVSMTPFNMFLGIAIAFSSRPLYSYYTEVPRLYGISVMDDQTLSGIIMWIPGSMMFLMAALVLLARIVQVEADKPVDPSPPWMVGETSLQGPSTHSR